MNSDMVRSMAMRGCESVGASASEQAYDALAQEADYRAREIIQEALNFATHAKRTKLCTEDVDRALKLRGVEQTYGHQDGERDLSFDKAKDDAMFPGVSFVEDKVKSLDEVLDGTDFPLLPRERGVHLHWLAVQGTKPLIPENVRLKRRRLGTKTSSLNLENGDVSGEDKGEKGTQESRSLEATVLSSYETNVGKGLKHVVSEELQSYFHKVTQGVLSQSAGPARESPGQGGFGAGPESAGASGGAFDPILGSLREDPGLQPLLPYFLSFIRKRMGEKSFFPSLQSCHAVLDLLQSLVMNPHLRWERHIHHVIPVVITFLVRKTLGGPGDDHWELRRQGGRVLALLCLKMEEERSQVALQTRVARTLVTKGLMDATKALTTHYGAIVGIYHLGDVVCENVLLPHTSTYMPCLGEALTCQTMNPLQQYEAYQCLEAILVAIGRLVHKSEYNLLLGKMHFEGVPLKRDALALAGPGAKAKAKAAVSHSPINPLSGKQRKAKHAKRLGAKDLKKTAKGRGVLGAFDCEEGAGGAKGGEGGGDGERQHETYFDVEVNNFTGMPTFERRNIVSQAFDVFGEHILPFLTCDAVLTCI